MLKHILATAPGNGSLTNGTRNMAATESPSERLDTPKDTSKIDDKSMQKAEMRDGCAVRSESREMRDGLQRIDRVDGLGPRVDARGDIRSDRSEHLYRDPSFAARNDPRSDYHGGDITPRDMMNKSLDSRNDSRNLLINRIEHHRNEYHSRDQALYYRGDLTPRELSSKQDQYAHHRYQNMSRRDPNVSNHSQLSVNTVHRLPQQQPLNISTLNSSKHSLGGTSSSASPGGRPVTSVMPKYPNGGLNISRVTGPGHSGRGTSGLSTLNPASFVPANVSRFMTRSKEVGIKEMLTSLGLLCLVSLLLALLSLIFLLKISPVTSTDVRELLRAEQLSVISAEEYVVVYEVTLALCALALSLNLCCLLVCAVQFLFAVKLVNSNGASGRTNKYLQKSSVTRVCAVGGFFISIPVFLTGIILYTFIQFHSTPAIITSVFIGLGIIFCGCAMVHNVFVWQKEKTNAVKALHSQPQVIEQPTLATSQSINTPQSITGNGYIAANGLVSSPSNTTHGTNMSYHNTTSGTSFSHHPLTILPHQGPYIIRPPTSTPPTPGDLGGSNRPPRPPRPPASGSVSPPGVPPATLDLSHPHSVDPHELSTLV